MRGALWIATAWALALADLVWWLPAILVALAALVLGRMRFWATMAAVDVLAAAGLRGAARRVCRRSLARCRRRAREMGS